MGKPSQREINQSVSDHADQREQTRRPRVERAERAHTSETPRSGVSEAERKKMSGIIVAMIDIAESVQSGRRTREYAVTDFEEEINNIKELILMLEGKLT